VIGDAGGLDTMTQPQVASEAAKAGLPFTLLVDGGGVPPVQDGATPTAVASISGSGTGMQLSAQVGDDVGVVRADFLVDGVVVASQAPVMPLKNGVLRQAYDASRLAAGPHSAQVKVWDASGKSGLSSAAAFTVGTTGSLDKPEQEPNDSRTTATVGPAGAGTVVGYFPTSTDNLDYYTFAVAANARLTLNMTGPTASAQDYDMFLETSSGTVLASSTADGTTESISYTNAGTARTLFLRVTRVSSYSRVTPYRIERK
jgi:hypothetical protein